MVSHKYNWEINHFLKKILSIGTVTMYNTQYSLMVGIKYSNNYESRV